MTPWKNVPADILDYFGFVYEITCKTTGQKYIGKKQLFSVTKVKQTGKKYKKRVVNASNWSSYTGSCGRLNELIASIGMDNFEFVILSLHTTKQDLAFAETKAQWQADVLRAKLPDGSRKYFNGRIEPIRHSLQTANRVQFSPE